MTIIEALNSILKHISSMRQLVLPRWYVFDAGRIEDACSAKARPALNIGITCRIKRKNNHFIARA